MQFDLQSVLAAIRLVGRKFRVSVRSAYQNYLLGAQHQSRKSRNDDDRVRNGSILINI